MAEIQAFRALRYDLGRVGALSDVVAPPYDVIDPVLQRQLYDQSPYNVIRLILNREEASDSEKENRYTRAAQFVRDWQQDGILAQDSARALYVYHQEFEIEERRYTRRGFLARVRLEEFGKGKIFPHEETMPGPKADRLKLFHATGMNLSPVFGLFPDRENQVDRLLGEAVGRSLPVEARDHLGVVHRLWPVTDQKTVSAVAGLLGPKPIFIADGHHRYETALRYREEQRAKGAVQDPNAAANFVLMMLVSMSDPGLVILPTHRLISSVPSLTSTQLQSLVGKHFQVDVIGRGEKGAAETWELLQTEESQAVLGFGTAADDTWHTAHFVAPESMAELASAHSPAWRSLAVSILHVLLLGKLVPAKFGKEPSCQYVHQLREVSDAVRARSCQLAALVPPASMEDVERIAGNLEKMPPKSTYFYPKLLSGLVFNSLKNN